MSDAHDHSHGHSHPFHLVNPSPWPAVGAASLFLTALGAAMSFHQRPGGTILVTVGLALVLYTMFAWWRDVIREGAVDHAHTRPVSRGLRSGMALFIVSEVMFFAAFFWAFFGASTLPRAPLTDVWAVASGVWPPKGIHPFDPWHLPFLNTLILLLSGCTVTWAHYALLHSNRKDMIRALWFTVVLGALFTSFQAFEYAHALFGFKEGIFATTFYMATGFHGFHVLVGTIFLAVCLVRTYKNQFSPEHHLGFEFAAWYWHFVDVVWLFLFVFVYGDFANKLMPVFEAIFNGPVLLALFAVSLIGAGFVGMRVIGKGGLPKVAHH
jgi:cytochrome c oxidase subunit 3